MAMTDYLIDGPKAARTVVLAHGAGAPMDSPFMARVAQGLAASGLRVVRFEFPYMAKRRTEGTRRGPDRARVLQETWSAVIADLGDPARLVVGGKSMGGRIASMIADAEGVAGWLCFSYPFHPAGRPQQTRTQHLQALRTPSIVLQGTRDALGNRAEVESYDLSSSIRVFWLEDGDHDLKPRKASGRTHDQNLDDAIAAAASFVKGL